MSTTQPTTTATAKPAAPTALQPASTGQNPEYAAKAVLALSGQALPRPVGYGLPCAKCRTYYAADLKACPICKSEERVVPIISPIRDAASVTEQKLPDPAALEEERERFLEEFQARMLASHAAPAPAAAPRCARAESHRTAPEPAAICQGCYDHLKERVDVLEAALHMDLKEATQIVYDAVWADTSDQHKTYQNAASALLAELRKRAGVPSAPQVQPPLID